MPGSAVAGADPAGQMTRDTWALRFVRAIPELTEFTGGPERFGHLLQSRKDTAVAWHGRRIHVEEFGEDASGPTIIFHHGYGAYSSLYAPFLAPLAAPGVKVVAIDRPGHGLSEGRRGDCSVEELAG